MEVVELRERDATEAWIIGGLALGRVAAPSVAELERVAPWILAVVDELPALPPAGVIADIGHVILGARSSLVPSLAPSNASRLRAAIRGYEDEWLGRLSVDPRLDAAIDAAAQLPPARVPHAIALVVGSLLERTRFVKGTVVNPGAARRLFSASPGDLLGRVHALSKRPSAFFDGIAGGYEGLVDAARAAPRLLDDPDVFALENVAVLASAAQRIAVSQVLEAAAELHRAMPRHLKPAHHRDGPAPTAMEDESAYPAGGFAALSTSGALENLVASETVYMEDGPDIDLFDVRYTEGELLFFTRDESVHVRPRREILFVLDTSLATLRFKDPELPWQRLVVLSGLLVCVTRKLYEWLAEEDLMVRFAFLRTDIGAAPLAPERALLELLLREWTDKGVASIDDASVDEVAGRASLRARRASVQAVYVGDAARAAAFRARAAGVTHVVLDTDAFGATWPSWVETMLALVDAIV